MMTGEIAKQKREALRFNQKRFAKLLGVHPETLCRMEASKRISPYVELIIELLERDEAAVKFAIERRGV
jgi:transcriptional regulator with XRE-family HTH domain